MMIDLAGITVDQGEIAELADVGRSAVGNWRKRHIDFPKEDDAGRFRLDEVERWLIENGKIAERVSAERVLWAISDAVRGVGLEPIDAQRLIRAAVGYVYLATGMGSVVPLLREPHDWSSVRRHGDDSYQSAVLVSAQALESSSPQYQDLFIPAFKHINRIPASLIRALLEGIAGALASGASPVSLIFEAGSRTRSVDRFVGEFATPASLRSVMIAVAGSVGGVVFDPACGEAGLLAEAASTAGASRAIGYDVSSEAIREARLRLLFESVDSELAALDSLRLDEYPIADLVLLDPPFGQRNWGDADLYTHAKWELGAPGPTGNEFAWLQVAALSILGGGRAVVAMPPGAAFGSRHVEIRRALVESGLLEAVVLLPPRLRPETSLQVSLWCLSSDPDRARQREVLFVDASSFGSRGRSQTVLADNEVESVRFALEAWRDGYHEDDWMRWSASDAALAANEWNLEPQRYEPLPEVSWEPVRDAAEERRRELSSQWPDVVEVFETLRSLPLHADGFIDRAPLEYVFEVIPGSAIPKPAKDVDRLESQRLINASIVSSGDFGRVMSVEPSDRRQTTVREGDIVMALTGRVGSSVLVDERLAGSAVSKDCVVLRWRGELGSLLWFAQWFQTTHFKTLLERFLSGTTIPRLSRKSLTEIDVPIPSENDVAAIDALERLGRAQQALRAYTRQAERLISDLRDLQFVNGQKFEW